MEKELSLEQLSLLRAVAQTIKATKLTANIHHTPTPLA